MTMNAESRKKFLFNLGIHSCPKFGSRTFEDVWKDVTEHSPWLDSAKIGSVESDKENFQEGFEMQIALLWQFAQNANKSFETWRTMLAENYGSGRESS